MALAIDASTPAAQSIVANVAAGTILTASGQTHSIPTISPPANSLLVLFISAGGGVNVTQSVSSVVNSGTALTWSKSFNAVNAQSNAHSNPNLGGTMEIWWAFNANSQTGINIDVKMAQATGGSSAPSAMVACVVFTGAATTQNGKVTTGNNSANTGTPSLSATTTVANSWVIGGVENFANGTAPTVGATQTVAFNGNNFQELNATDGDGYWAQRQNATTPVSGTNVTINDTAPTNISFNMVWVEIVPLASTFIAPNPMVIGQGSLPTAQTGVVGATIVTQAMRRASFY